MTSAKSAGLAAMLAAGLALALSSANSACDLKTTDSDAGAVDAGAATGTIGGQCTKIDSAYCQRAIACLAYTGTLTQCVADAQIKCCADKCGNPAMSSDTSVNTCVDTISQEDCNAIAQGGTPVNCAGIPKIQ